MDGRKILELYTHITKLRKNIIIEKKIDTILKYLGININNAKDFNLRTCNICNIIGVFNLNKSFVFDVFNNIWIVNQFYTYCSNCRKK